MSEHGVYIRPHTLASPKEPDMRTTHLTLLSLLVFATACGDAGSIIGFTFEEETDEVVVDGRPSTPIELPLADFFPPLNLEVDLSEELAARDTGPASGVYLTGLDMVITDTEIADGDSDDFDFIDTIDVYVESTKEGTELTRTKIASLADVPVDQTTVSFTVEEDFNLKDYVDEGMRLTIDGAGQPPEDDTSLKSIVELRVTLL